MSRQARYVTTANSILTDGLRTSKELSLDAVDVLHSFASLLVPMSVAVVPNGQRLVPSIDAAVDRGYDLLAQAVEAPYDRAVATLDRLSQLAA